ALREGAARSARRVRVREHLRTQGVVAYLAAPGLCEGQEEPLIAREAVQNRRFRSIERELVRGVGHLETTEIADVLAHREIAVHACAFERAVGCVESAELLRRLEESGVGLGRPPVAHLSGAVELAAFVVEAVTDLMADDRADRAVVDRRIGVRIEERRLQDARREGDLILGRIVVGVDGLRRHEPLAAIDGLVDALDVTLPLEYPRVAHILEVFATLDAE